MAHENDKELLENRILSFAEQINEEVYTSQIDGKISVPQMQEIYKELSLWSSVSEQLINLIHSNGISFNT